MDGWKEFNQTQTQIIVFFFVPVADLKSTDFRTKWTKVSPNPAPQTCYLPQPIHLLTNTQPYIFTWVEVIEYCNSSRLAAAGCTSVPRISWWKLSLRLRAPPVPSSHFVKPWTCATYQTTQTMLLMIYNTARMCVPSPVFTTGICEN